MAKVTYMGMASPDSEISRQGTQIGGLSVAEGNDDLQPPEVIYEHERNRGELDFVCTVEWSWSSYHERINSYYFGVTDTEYELWSHYNDESTGNQNWCCCVVANKTSVGIVKAPGWLLEHLWRHESAESSICMFDMVSEEGLLEQEAVFRIGESVWPE